MIALESYMIALGFDANVTRELVQQPTVVQLNQALLKQWDLITSWHMPSPSFCWLESPLQQTATSAFTWPGGLRTWSKLQAIGMQSYFQNSLPCSRVHCCKGCLRDYRCVWETSRKCGGKVDRHFYSLLTWVWLGSWLAFRSVCSLGHDPIMGIAGWKRCLGDSIFVSQPTHRSSPASRKAVGTPRNGSDASVSNTESRANRNSSSSGAQPKYESLLGANAQLSSVVETAWNSYEADCSSW